MSAHTTAELSSTFASAYDEFIAASYGEEQLLAQACRYALCGQGKRIRPLFVLLSSQALGGEWQRSLLPAFAIEMVHTYSLVHDDLPCMDNDDLRRGRATVHKKFDEATALLVGDTIFCDACAVLAGSFGAAWSGYAAQDATPLQRLQMLQVLTKSSGSSGIVLGQVQDLQHTGGENQLISLDEIVATYRRKTGSLLAAACAMGAISAQAAPEVVARMSEFGALLGTAFQIIDDLLDDSASNGKTPGKDRSQDKKTLISLVSPQAARELAAVYTEEALALLDRSVDAVQGATLREFAHSLLSRQV
jgi:geranylgeranyl pyrophosphate synthase